MFKNIITAGVTALFVAILVVVLVGGNHQSGQVGYSANGNSTNYNVLGASSLFVGSGCNDANSTCTGAAINSSGVIKSGGIDTVVSTSTQTAYTVTQADLLAASLLTFTPLNTALTATLPASSTLTTFLPNAGDTSSIVVYNTSSATTTIIAGGTGTTLLSASSTATIQATKAATLDCTRLATTNVVCLMTTAN